MEAEAEEEAALQSVFEGATATEMATDAAVEVAEGEEAVPLSSAPAAAAADDDSADLADVEAEERDFRASLKLRPPTVAAPAPFEYLEPLGDPDLEDMVSVFA